MTPHPLKKQDKISILILVFILSLLLEYHETVFASVRMASAFMALPPGATIYNPHPHFNLSIAKGVAGDLRLYFIPGKAFPSSGITHDKIIVIFRVLKRATGSP